MQVDMLFLIQIKERMWGKFARISAVILQLNCMFIKKALAYKNNDQSP